LGKGRSERERVSRDTFAEGGPDTLALWVALVADEEPRSSSGSSFCDIFREEVESGFEENGEVKRILPWLLPLQKKKKKLFDPKKTSIFFESRVWQARLDLIQGVIKMPLVCYFLLHGIVDPEKGPSDDESMTLSSPNCYSAESLMRMSQAVLKSHFRI
jgi:hypothetical protein